MNFEEKVNEIKLEQCGAVPVVVLTQVDLCDDLAGKRSLKRLQSTTKNC